MVWLLLVGNPEGKATSGEYFTQASSLAPKKVRILLRSTNQQDFSLLDDFEAVKHKEFEVER